MTTPTRALGLCATTLALSIACASEARTPLPTSPLDALTADSARIMEGLRHLSSDTFAGRESGTEGAALARAWISAQLVDAGVEPVGGVFEWPFTWAGGSTGEPRQGVNLAGVVRGTDHPGRYLVLSAHYDHLGVRDGEIHNGADDNASGAVALLAFARALRAAPPRHSILIAAFDAEESGLQGARAWVDDPPVPLDELLLNVNMDMVSRTDGLLWAAGAAHTPALRTVLEGVAADAPVELRLGHDRPGAPEGDDWTRSSDHGPFHQAGVPFVYFGVEDHADYHRPTDDFERVDPGEYMDALRTILSAVLALDAALPLPPDTLP